MAQEPKRDTLVRLPNPSAQPFAAALKRARFFAVVLFWVALVCLGAHVAAFVMAEWVGLYEAAPAAPAEIVTPPAPAEPAEADAAPPEAFLRGGPFVSVAAAAEAAPDATPVDPPPDEEKAWDNLFWTEDAPAATREESGGTVTAGTEPVEPAPLSHEERQALAAQRRHTTACWLAGMRVVGTLASVLLWATVFVYLQIALLGRLGGIRQITSAVFLLLLYVALVLPWERMLGGLWFGAFWEFDAMVAAHTARLEGLATGLASGVGYYGRFFALPLAAVMVLAAAGLQFASGYGESVVANE